MRALVLGLILAVAGVARADELDEARRLEAALDYERALASVEAVITSGRAKTPARFVELHLYAGRLAAGLDRGAVAEDHYLRALAVQPGATLPDGTSPKLVAPLDTARRRAVPLRLSAMTADGAVYFLVQADALGLARGIALVVTEPGGARRELEDRTALRLVVPAGTTALEVAALDASGNVVLRMPAPAIAVEAPPPRLVSDEGPSIPARWSTWAVATGVVLAAGTFSAWRFSIAQRDWDDLRAQPDMHDYSALTAVEDRGRRWGLAANIAFGVATATGITAAVLFYRQRHRSVVVTPVGVSGEF